MTNELSIAIKLANGKNQNGTNKLLWLSIAGITISIVVILLSLSIILGFKRQISTFAYSQTGEISLYPYGENWSANQSYINVPNKLIQYLVTQPEVETAFPILQSTALLKTESDFKGIILYGVEDRQYPKFFIQNIESGISPTFSVVQQGDIPIMLPNIIAEKMNINIGDKVQLYFMGNKVKVRSFTLRATYNSAGIEDMPALCPASTLRKLNKLEKNQYSRIIVNLTTNENSPKTAVTLAHRLNNQNHIPIEGYGLSTAEELMPDIFSWLGMLDSNVIFLIVVMLIIGGFTMITGVIIIILDKTNHIGILKALGASNVYIRRVFSYIALRLILQGILLGNIIGALLLGIQWKWKLIKLNPKDYYMDSIPVVFDIEVWVLANITSFILLGTIILIPTRIISGISPSKTIRFE